MAKKVRKSPRIYAAKPHFRGQAKKTHPLGPAILGITGKVTHLTYHKPHRIKPLARAAKSFRLRKHKAKLAKATPARRTTAHRAVRHHRVTHRRVLRVRRATHRRRRVRARRR